MEMDRHQPGAGCDDRLVQPLSTGRAGAHAADQRLARLRQARDRQADIHPSVAKDQQPAHDRAAYVSAMKTRRRSGSTGFHQTPSRFSQLATITPSATLKISPTLAGVTPDPTTTGSAVPSAMVRSSSIVAASPVRCPVAIATSASKNSTSRANSPIERSAVMAWAPCLTWTSAKMRTSRGVQHGAVAGGEGGGALDDPLVGDIGVGPLIDPDEAGAGGLRHRERLHGTIGEDVHTGRQTGGPPHRVCHHGHASGGLWAEMFGFGEGDVAVVFNDQPVDTTRAIPLSLGHGEGDDVGDGLAVIAGTAGQRQGVDDGDDRLEPAEQGFHRVRFRPEDGFGRHQDLRVCLGGRASHSLRAGRNTRRRPAPVIARP